MTAAAVDDRSPQRRARDEAIAAEPPLAPPVLPPGATPSPMESHLHYARPCSPLSPEQRAELARRDAELEADPGRALTWEQIRAAAESEWHVCRAKFEAALRKVADVEPDERDRL